MVYWYIYIYVYISTIYLSVYYYYYYPYYGYYYIYIDIYYFMGFINVPIKNTGDFDWWPPHRVMMDHGSTIHRKVWRCFFVPGKTFRGNHGKSEPHNIFWKIKPHNNFTMVYGRYIKLVNGIINQLITGGHHLVSISIGLRGHSTGNHSLFPSNWAVFLHSSTNSETIPQCAKRHCAPQLSKWSVKY